MPFAHLAAVVVACQRERPQGAEHEPCDEILAFVLVLGVDSLAVEDSDVVTQHAETLAAEEVAVELRPPRRGPVDLMPLTSSSPISRESTSEYSMNSNLSGA